jgi:hypothetical protein
MPEILTESFCERCGTRYTFESVAPRKTRRLGQFKTLSKGVKNWVMSDDSSLDEALAEARSDEEREVTSHQLDAFHSTFNFCMSCRQYTCANCWNTPEGRCLSCAPNLAAQDILPAPFPEIQPADHSHIELEAWPEVDLTAMAAGNGAELGLEGLPANGNGYHANGNGATADEPIEEFDAAARLAFLSGEVAEPPTRTAEPVDWIGEEPAIEATAVDEATVEPAAIETVLVEPAMVEPAMVEPAAMAAEPEPAPVEPVVDAQVASAASEPERSVVADVAKTVVAAEILSAATDEDPVAAATRAGQARTSDLLTRFRPGQNIDAELAAFEADQQAQEEADRREREAAALAAAAAAALTPDRTDEPEIAEPGVAADADAVPARPDDERRLAETALAAAAVHHVAEPEAERVVEIAGEAIHPEAEPVAADAPVAEPEPVAAEAPAELAAAAAAEVAPEAPAPIDVAPAPAPVREDIVEQPTWQIFAPDQAVGPTGQPVPPAQPAIPPAVPTQASGEPQWPVRPGTEDSPSMALLANRSGKPSDAMWAASAQQVVAAPVVGGSAPIAGVQPCSNCGLSLSANARFCRRCGTRQG